MKFNIFILICLVSVFSCSTVLALNSAETTNKAPTNQPLQNTKQNNVGKILGWLVILDKNEISLADEAVKKNINPIVKDYAKTLINDHTKNLNETLKVSHKMKQQPLESGDVALLKRKGQEEVAILRPLDNEKFAVIYMDAMVKGHTDALNKINECIATASNPELKKLLEATHVIVKKHLQEAGAIQTKLKANS